MKNKDIDNNSIDYIKLLWHEAQTHFTNKEYAQAIEPIDKILEFDSADINALLNKGAALYFLKKYDDALPCFDAILQYEPQNTNALKNKAGTLYNLGQYEEASNIYDVLLTGNGDDMSVLKNKALTSVKLNNLEEAADAYHKILSVDKHNKQIAMKLAEVYNVLQRYQEELTIYNELLQADPLNIDLLNKKGTTLVNLERYDNAVDTFNRILSINLQDEEALLSKQNALIKWDTQRKEQEEEKTASEYKTARIYDLNNEGYDLLDKKEYEQALACFDKAINIDSGNSDALAGKGIAKVALDDNEDALQYLELVLNKDPQNVKAIAYKGKAFFNLNQYNEALTCFNSVLEIEPNNFDAIYDKEKTLALIKNNDVIEEVDTHDTHDQQEDTESTESILTEALKAIENEDYKTSIFYFEQIADNTLLDADMLYQKAMAYHHLKKYDETINCCNNLLERQPNLISAIALKKDAQTQQEKQHPQEKINESTASASENNKTEKELSDQNQQEKSAKLEALLIKGYNLFQEGEYEQAMPYFDQASDLDPNNIRVLIFRGTTFHLQDKLDEAIDCYNQVLEQQPQNVKVLSNKGSALEELAQYNEAIECYNKALEAQPQNTNTLFLLGMAYKTISEYPLAIDYFRQVLEIEPDHAEAIEQKEATEEFLDRVIQETSQEKEEEKADSIVEEQTILPTTDKQKIEEVENNEESEKQLIEEATTEKEVIIEVVEQNTLEPEETEAEKRRKEFDDLDQKFNLFYGTNRFEEAIEVLDQMIEIAPDNIDLIYNKGLSLAMLERYNDAIVCFDKVLATDPSKIKALYSKGLSYSYLKKYAQAIDYFDRVLSIKPNNIDALFNKGVIYFELNEYNKAIEYYDRALAIKYDYVEAIYNKGVALAKLKNYHRAIEYYDKALAISPDNIDVFYNKGNSLSMLEKYNDAIKCYDKVLAIDPENIKAFSNKGASLGILEKYNEAIECYDKVLASDPDRKNALHNKGIACLYTNKYKESAISFNKVGYTALDVLSLLTSLKEINEVKTLFDVISELIDLNENDYFNNIVDKSDKQRSAYKNIYIRSLKIMKKLHTNNAIEQRVAHYTSHTVANLLLGLNNEQDEPSPFRLNSIATANDPKEGVTLFDFLKVNGNDNQENTDYQAFIGCFSFNTESLSQFRLYSKDNQQEATGVSIVANDNFFSKQINFTNSLIRSKNQFLNNNQSDKDELKAESLFRCIYVDPKTGRIISIGHKEAYTIYRENDIDKNIDSKIDAYNDELKILLVELKSQMDILSKEVKNDKLDLNIVRQLLIVLRYLVKHVAFKDEQECRIINIEQLTSDKVKINPADTRLYIDYIPMSKESVDIIYSAPLIDQFKIFRDIVWKKRTIRTQICDHPFADDRKTS